MIVITAKDITAKNDGKMIVFRLGRTREFELSRDAVEALVDLGMYLLHTKKPIENFIGGMPDELEEAGGDLFVDVTT